MLEDMRIRGMGDKAQKSHIRAIMGFAKFLNCSPDTAAAEELRAYQLHMTDTGVTASTFNTRIIALRFFFGINRRYQQWLKQELLSVEYRMLTGADSKPP
jgi:integrase/recombinase XerD